jgi:hypothetical protein
MNAALFKWWVAPPVILVAGNGSLTKTEYHHPITAGKINWAGVSLDAARERLQPILTSDKLKL